GFSHHRRRGRHQPLDRRPARQDRQQVQARPLQRQACPPDQRLLLPARRGPPRVRRPARRHPRAGEAPVDRAARDQRGPADLRGHRPGRRGGRRRGRCRGAGRHHGRV
ncbi:MAG: DNA-directed RNA polymerase omega subunit, partial [uncultured Nocardioides sp.]